jgi:predicted DNA-binding antitoxin AbrB/MazE fold protein
LDLTGRRCLFLSFSSGGRGFVPAAPAVYYRQRSLISSRGAEAMTITIEAVYENGVLKPAWPLPFKERERVKVTVSSPANWVQETAGMIQWTGDPEVLRRIAEDDEFSILEAYDHDELARCLGDSPPSPDKPSFAQGQ